MEMQLTLFIFENDLSQKKLPQTYCINGYIIYYLFVVNFSSLTECANKLEVCYSDVSLCQQKNQLCS